MAEETPPWEKKHWELMEIEIIKSCEAQCFSQDPFTKGCIEGISIALNGLKAALQLDFESRVEEEIQHDLKLNKDQIQILIDCLEADDVEHGLDEDSFKLLNYFHLITN